MTATTWDELPGTVLVPGTPLMTMRSLGHRLVDTSCSRKLLEARYPAWKLMESDAGRLYASARLHGSRQGTTVFAWTLVALQDEMAQAEQPPGPSIRYFGGMPG